MSRWATVAPLNSAWKGPNFRLTQPMDVGCGVQLIPAPDWLKSDNITRWMSVLERDSFIGESLFALSFEYEADGNQPSVDNMNPFSKRPTSLRGPSLRTCLVTQGPRHPAWTRQGAEARKNGMIGPPSSPFFSSWRTHEDSQH